ncbi:MAG: hypothetical protein GXY83_05950 [Rhodopirellula sp.]|nr:hypothetical protein [Rhodopirellula sp.]
MSDRLRIVGLSRGSCRHWHLLVVGLLLVPLVPRGLPAAPWDPAATDYTGRTGQTFYVSRQGDNSDGASWATAFRTIQTAISAIPDDQGGHRVIVRPDTYNEANLHPAHRGAKGAYNLLIGDHDGRLGSGAQGWVLIDSGDPDMGFKSWDWWSSFAASDKKWPTGNNQQTFSSIVCDRWIFRNLYATGGDAGLFWDLTDKSGEEFTVIVEDCVGIGRAFGGGVCYPIVRQQEPSVFRRSYFLALDWVGDTAAVLLGGWENTMPEVPHAIFDDCTFVHPDNAVAMSYASHCARGKFVHCRMIVLNFTQPEMGGRSTGIVCTENHRPGARLHVDLEDCLLAGYSLFTPGEASQAVSFATQGKVQVYLQFKQSLPDGFQRLGNWPAELFFQMAPPRSPSDAGRIARLQ